MYQPPSSRDNPTREDDRIWERNARKHPVNKQPHLSERSISESRSVRQVTQELIRSIEIPKFFVSIPRCEQLRVHFDGVLWESYIQLKLSVMNQQVFLGESKSIPRLTEVAGGTDGALSSGLGPESAEIGRMRSAFFAGECSREEAKKVADTVAISKNSRSATLVPKRF